MKGSCPKCGDVIDEVEYTQFNELCYECSREEDKYYGVWKRNEN